MFAHLIKIDAVGKDEMKDADQEAEQQKAGGMLQRIEPVEVMDGKEVRRIVALQVVRDPLRQIANGAPERGGNTTAKSVVDKGSLVGLRFIFLFHEQAKNDHNETITCVTEHQTKQEIIEDGHDEVRVDVLVRGERVHVRNALHRLAHRVVEDSDGDIIRRIVHILQIDRDIEVVLQLLLEVVCFDLRHIAGQDEDGVVD